MGLMDSLRGVFNKGKAPTLPKPPMPPPPKPSATFSEHELPPPPKLGDFEDEIPELPDMEIPEGFGGESSAAPRPQPKAAPPPQREAEPVEAWEPEALSSEPPSESEEGDGEISFQRIETPELKHPLEKPVESTPSLPKLEPPRIKPEEPPLVTHVDDEGHMFIRENEFADILSGLSTIEGLTAKSTHHESLLDLDARKENALREFAIQIKAAYELIEEIDHITFGKR